MAIWICWKKRTNVHPPVKELSAESNIGQRMCMQVDKYSKLWRRLRLCNATAGQQQTDQNTSNWKQLAFHGSPIVIAPKLLGEDIPAVMHTPLCWSLSMMGVDS
jgi:hypothetical protein